MSKLEKESSTTPVKPSFSGRVKNKERRDFIVVATNAMFGIGAAAGGMATYRSTQSSS